VVENPHFATVEDWAAAEGLLGFTPLRPSETAGYVLDALRIHVMDHRMRELPRGQRTLEAHYVGFVFTQSRPGEAEARRLAFDLAYGAAARQATVAGREGRTYEEGLVPEPDDPDGQMPAVVVWPDGDLFLLIASGTDGVDVPALLKIAESVYR